MKSKLLVASAFGLCLSTNAFANDIAGKWLQIDDKTGTSKAVIEIRKDTKNSYTAQIVKITPRPGYTPQEKCKNCPAPYTNQPILGMDVYYVQTVYQTNRKQSVKKIILMKELKRKYYTILSKNFLLK